MNYHFRGQRAVRLVVATHRLRRQPRNSVSQRGIHISSLVLGNDMWSWRCHPWRSIVLSLSMHTYTYNNNTNETRSDKTIRTYLGLTSGIIAALTFIDLHCCLCSELRLSSPPCCCGTWNSMKKVYGLRTMIIPLYVGTWWRRYSSRPSCETSKLENAWRSIFDGLRAKLENRWRSSDDDDDDDKLRHLSYSCGTQKPVKAW